VFSCARREKAEGKRDVTDIDRLRGRSLGDMLATRHSLLSVCHRTRRFLRIKPNTVELAWIPMQKKKPNKSPDFLPYLRYNCLSTVVFWVYQYRVPRC